jgi:hypothetical protein
MRGARAFVLGAATMAGTACARHRAAPNDLRPALAATRRAIADARARLDSALATADRAAAAELLAESVTVHGRATTPIAQGRAGVLAHFDTARAEAGAGAVVLLARGAESCLDAGYEIGTYTRYRVDSAGQRVGTSGDYAIAWRVRDDRAKLGDVVLGDAGAFRRPPRAVVCATAGTLRQRASRVSLGVASVFSHWPGVRSFSTSSERAGWSAGAPSGSTGASPCVAGTELPSLADETRLQLSGRLRLAPAWSAEVVSVPQSVKHCTRALNPATRTAVTQTLRVSDHAALVSLTAGGARVGAGLAYARVSVRSFEDSVGASAWNRAVVATDGGALGLAGQAAYTFAIGSHLYGEISARARLTPSVTLDRLLRYSPEPVTTSGYALGIATGIAF